jgi:hypothetical protein
MTEVNAPTTIVPTGTHPIPERVTADYIDDGTGIGMAVCIGEVIDRLREEGGVMEATTPGKFMMVEGDKVYPTFLDMLRDQPQPPDPVFKENDVLPIMEDKGVPLGELDEMDIEFKKMYEEMFSRTSELGVMGAGDFEARLLQRQNELSNSKVENPNGGSPSILSSGGSPIYAPQRPSTPFYHAVQIPCTGDLVPPPEDGSYASDAKDHDGDDGAPVDA